MGTGVDLSTYKVPLQKKENHRERVVSYYGRNSESRVLCHLQIKTKGFFFGSGGSPKFVHRMNKRRVNKKKKRINRRDCGRLIEKTTIRDLERFYRLMDVGKICEGVRKGLEEPIYHNQIDKIRQEV